MENENVVITNAENNDNKKSLKTISRSHSTVELSSEDKLRAEELSKTIDIRNDSTITTFGMDTQKKFGEASNKMLSQVKNKEAEEAGSALSELVEKMQGMDLEQSGVEKFLSKIPIIKNLVSHSRKIIAQHTNVESNLDLIVGKLDSSMLALTKDNANLQNLKTDNMNFLGENKVNIEAIRIIMRDLEKKQIPELQKYVDKNPDDDIKIQELHKMKDSLNRLDKKVYNLELFNTAVIQSLPRLDLIQNGNIQLCDNIQNTVLTVIPLWRGQIAERVTLIKQSKVAKNQEAVYDLTNRLISDNSKTTKENTLAIAKQMERGIIDIETLKQTNKDFIDTLDGVIKIREEGSKKRLEAEKVLHDIKKELSDKMKSINTQTTVTNDSVVDTDYVEVEDFTMISEKNN
jgi:uncharacterized protein YaaN involved in tellurite resistance